jgi:SOS-response transcriptional repressor LexA
MGTFAAPKRHGKRGGGLTPRQRELYRWFYGQTMRNGFQPSYREVGARFGIIEPSAVAAYFRPLIREGYVAPPPRYEPRRLGLLRTPDGRPFPGFEDAPAYWSPVGDAGPHRPLTGHQREVYAWLYGETLRCGFQPSNAEIAAHFGWSSNNAARVNLIALEQKGYVTSPSLSGQARSRRFLLRPDGRPFRGFVEAPSPIPIPESTGS